MPADDATFRGAMRLLASGVTIIAAGWQGERSGLTATAVCSLALSPARVLACINRSGHTIELVQKSRCMSVNLLAQDQEALARRFSSARTGAGADRFLSGDWHAGQTGSPLLSDALASLDCRVAELMPLDTHAIVIGIVEEILFGPRRAPLIHFESGYNSLAGPVPSPWPVSSP